MRIASFLCVLAGLLPLVVITVLSFADLGFSIFYDYISRLGTGQYAIIFNGSLVAAGLLATPFILTLNGRYRYLTILFLGTAVALVGVGVFPTPDPYHWHFSAAFFFLAFLTMLTAGMAMRSVDGKVISMMLALFGFIGLIVFSPAVETIMVFVIGGWVAAVGLLYDRRLLKRSL